MPGVNAEISASINAVILGTTTAVGTANMPVQVASALNFTQGTATIGQADEMYSATRTLAASANENLDLAGVLTDAFGTIITFAQIVAIYVRASAANTNNVIVGGATTNAFNGPLSATGTYTLRPGEFYLATSQRGWPVVATTGDLLRIANSGAGTSVTYDIVIIGRTVIA